MKKTNKPFEYRTYRLSKESIEILERLNEEFTQEMGLQFSLNKLVNCLIKYCEDVTFNKIVNKNKAN